jgi:hypothetical protein
MNERPPICCLCWLDGIQSPAIVKGWDGVPICRDHLAETIERTSGQPAVGYRAMIKPPLELQ